jgi:predicted dehydrogenase
MALSVGMIGCGGMARGHLNGLIELHTHQYPFRLSAVCDAMESRAAEFAGIAREQMGMTPAVYSDFRRMLGRETLDAVLIATDHRQHHTLTIPCLEAGCHVMVEKPIAITVKAGWAMIRAAERHNRILAVAEQYRRSEDPRAIKAALSAGAIGAPYMIFRQSGGVGSAIFCGTPWRHSKADVGGGPMLDNGVHDADLFLYWIGDVEEVTALATTFEKTRTGKVTTGEIATIHPTADDTGMALLRFANGCIGQWTESWAMHGQPFGHSILFGSKGSINNSELNVDGPDGKPVKTEREAFLAQYKPESLFPDGIKNSVTLEQREFFGCIQHGGTPEVDGYIGLKAEAICYAVYESSAAGGRPVKVQDVLDGKVDAYQQELNASLGL